MLSNRCCTYAVLSSPVNIDVVAATKLASLRKRLA